MNKREFRNRCNVVTRLLSVSINSLSQTYVNSYLKPRFDFSSHNLSLNSHNPVFLCLTLITPYILLFLKPFRYCIDTNVSS